ncbi:TPR-like protein [Penicillium atrosanguineum]|uniref:TPR-like protein n=1 Tax=Penicillium atrosanguineum TaxID=1132637 RepID=A0A9W9PYP3_9EURO|nr:TPR-like protein [Penicillium atrosanguineum]KAJ5318668.1 TPR-like protein [Penicillium atrosanguineum]
METIEALMKSIAEDVQSIFRAHKVLAADSKQNAELDRTIGEMRFLMAFSFQKPFGICLGRAPFLSTEFFVGRDDGLAALANALNPSLLTSELQHVVLGGVRGVGKTQLAKAYGESRSGSYESVFWLNAASESLLRQSFESLAVFIFNDAPNEHAVIKLVHDWLSDATNPRWLLIFDGYNDPNQFNIEDYYPPSFHGAIIVTTRRPEFVKGTAIHVQPLQKLEDSLSILQNRSQRENVQSGGLSNHVAKIIMQGF